MNIDDYVQHIAQKYRLATAIGVIQSKPINTTLDEYVSMLKTKITEHNMDSDSEVSITSVDFEIDEVNCDSGEVCGASDGFERTGDVSALNTDTKESRYAAFVPEYSSQTTFYEGTQNDLTTLDNNSTLLEIDSQITYFQETQNSAINEIVTKATLSIKDKSTKNDLRDKNLENSYRHVYVNTNELEETQIYKLPEFIDNCTHYSATPNTNIIPIGRKYINNNNKTNIINMAVNNNEGLLDQQNAQNLDLYFDQTPKMDFILDDKVNQSNKNSFITASDERNVKYAEIDEVINKGDTTIDLVGQHKSNRVNTSEIDNDKDDLNGDEATNDAGNIKVVELTVMNEEVVPFKILEELNRVKMFLKRRGERRTDGSTSDSGYKTDSQGLSIRNASQLSISGINQSALCLLEYLQTCPLVPATVEINTEISEILGSLVDQLHEDEMYPTFIEFLLKTIDVSLRRISEADGSSVSALSTEDELFQRILLINKSKNIQKYTISNITKYLENLTTELHKTETYEITNINAIENLAHLLYILELILSDYTKNRSQPTTQTSQDEYKLTRSTMSDVWRRKWNSDVKEGNREINVSDGGGTEKCVLAICSETLNKMTVNCMESYSLISYLALKCYNLLQTV